jgi:WD40 repeat protein
MLAVGVSGDSVSVARSWQHSIGDHVIALTWSPGGDMLAADSISGRVSIYDAEDGTLRYSLSAHAFGLAALAWRPGASQLATVSQDGKVRLWDADNAHQIACLEGGDVWVEHLAWRSDANELASAAGRILRLWSSDGSLMCSHAEHPSTIADIKCVPKKNEVAAACYGGLICWSSDQSKPLREFPYKGSTLAVAWSPDGRFVATGNQDSTIHLWIAESGKDLHMSGYPTKIRELSWHSSSRYLATGGGGSSVVVWDFAGKGPAGSRPVSLEHHQKFLTQLAYQNTGEILASGCEDWLLALWHPTAKAPLLTSLRLRTPVAQLAWSADDLALAVGTANGLVTVLRVC